MMRGHFSELGELLFDIELVSRNNERIAVEALFDTGFTDWLAMNVQDAESLGWTLIETERNLQTARGQEFFDLYIGTIAIDNLEFIVYRSRLRVRRDRGDFVRATVASVPTLSCRLSSEIFNARKRLINWSIG